MDKIEELNICGTCKHSHLIPDIGGEIALNICRIGSRAVKKDGGMTYCTEWTRKERIS